MLLQFRFSNFRSFRREQELSLVASRRLGKLKGQLTIPKSSEKALRVAAVYGANASGKSNLLKAMHFVHKAVMQSQRSWEPGKPIPIQQFILDVKKGSSFEVTFVVSRVRYQYGFELDSKEVLKEWLVAYPRGVKQSWFVREGNNFKFSRNMPGPNKTVQSLTRSNSLFLSAAAQNNHERLGPVYQWFVKNLQLLDEKNLTRRQVFSAQLFSSRLREHVTEMMNAADLGISDIKVEDEDPADRRQLIYTAVARELATRQIRFDEESAKLKRISFLHHLGRKKNEALIRLEDESRGTQIYFGLIGPVLSALASGAVVLVDELDASLHTILASDLVRLFDDPRYNTLGSQLIFSTHDTNLLNAKSLRRDQVWFVEKTEASESRLYPLSDFRARKQENVERGYVQGRYGAVPFIQMRGLLESAVAKE
jgi:uncharacterized protein